ncbi:PREDICTED: leucine-rich repeat-containing protein 40-like [Dufourea novaeangliae]|uniref:Leucine-rich repeat-containing protein 40 n=1 Tax=Dufourea novaeangliae TaxID=178035 RepID=A0A154PA54_DUFNO|nr:PREDICTED: leucine-rich repeat-containing protein 40-like [Dufourea novaeangliae]KZC08775.1 Leucine-rich repeat-containing protein 40 [Dufourea novaeangliae]
MSGVKKKINHLAVFKQQTKNEDNAELSEVNIISARKTGNLNLSSRGLCTVPNRIWNINDLTEEEVKELHFELDYVHTNERWWEQEPLKILDLSCNSLTTISSKIECLSELTTLRLHNNLLEDLPPEIGNLSKLKVLNVSNNKLKKLPHEFYKLNEVQELYLKNNGIIELDPAIGDLIMLSHLDLSYNNLSELPVGMGYLVRLISLDVSHNMLKELPPDLMSMRALQKLDASYNELEILPPFGELRKVEAIMLQTNKLTTFPDVSGCTLLRVLHLADNNIIELDMSCLEGVGQLRTLTLGNNRIDTIPEEIIKLVNLEILDLSHNSITIVSNYIGIMPNLKQFVIDGNNVQNIRTDIIRCGTSRILKHIRQSVTSTNLSTKEYIVSEGNTSVYPDKYTMQSTKLLSLAGRNLVELPQEVLENACKADISTMDLSRNKLSDLPDELSIITSIGDLKLTSNQLTHIPEWIGEKYKYLQALDLSKNLLESLPSSLGLLKYLREINISSNRYKEIPESIYEVEPLEIFIANDNAITDIDVSSLQKLRKLAILNLANNNIGYIPPNLGNLKNLRTLSLSGNYFKQPRQAILAKSTEEILAYLRDRIPR